MSYAMTIARAGCNRIATPYRVDNRKLAKEEGEDSVVVSSVVSRRGYAIEIYANIIV